MAHLIDKDALVAEIERRQSEHDEKKYDYASTDHFWRAIEDKDILSFINTLEVKEVDLEKDVESYWKQSDLTWCRDAYSMTHIRSMMSDVAKHFFELALKAQKGE